MPRRAKSYDSMIAGAPLGTWLLDTGPLMLVGLVLALVAVRLPAVAQ